MAAPKAISVALYLNEDYDSIARDANMKAHFARQMEGDIANALEVAKWRINVNDLMKVNILSVCMCIYACFIHK